MDGARGPETGLQGQELRSPAAPEAVAPGAETPEEADRDRAESDRREALLQAGLALASELSLSAVLQKIVETASRVADARFGALGVLSPEGTTIERFLTHGVTEEERRAIGSLPVGRGLLGVLIADVRPLRLRRMQDDPRSVGFPPNHPEMSSFLGVPILVHGKVYGNLYLTEKRGAEEFTEADERALVTLATQAGVAIENARLYEEAQLHRRRLEAIDEVNTAILAGREADRVLPDIARHARDLVGAALATVAVPVGERGQLVLQVADGQWADRLRGTVFPATGSISGEVMTQRAPLIVEDASTDPRAAQPVVALGDMGPALFVPLAVRDRVFGTLTVANARGGRPFSEDDLALVQL
ncbi:MAG TPA: GAF domain-containing protein, partial [Actinomycetota bacterium]|nr:GAF domain-containing protein [Actinomycetota bacterium]